MVNTTKNVISKNQRRKRRIQWVSPVSDNITGGLTWKFNRTYVCVRKMTVGTLFI